MPKIPPIADSASPALNPGPGPGPGSEKDLNPDSSRGYDVLFEPVKIGPVVAPNRFFAVPHATGHSPLMPNGSIGMREMKAQGGWGTVCMQLVEIDPTSNISNLPMETLWDDQDVAAQARLVERVKAHGALVGVELAHTGLRSRNIATGTPILGPSCLPNLKPDFPAHSKAMTKADIADFRASHRAAVRRAKQAGYDIVYVYAAHDASILWHFLNPLYNKRRDEYGGCFENRLRLLREVLEDTIEVAAGEVAVALRIPVHDFKAGSPLTFDNEGRAVVEALAELPDLWDVNVAGWPRDSGTSRFDPEGFQDDYTRFVKQLTTKPVVGVGRYTSPDAMVAQVRRGHLDLIGGARPSIADPFLPHKIKQGRADEVRECIGCNICVASDAYSVPLRCTQNPTISEEWRRGWHPEKVPKPISPSKRILVVGGGPAGLECAEVASRAGLHVTLADRASQFGGRLLFESSLPGLTAWRRVVDHRLYRLQQRANVALYANSDLSGGELSDFSDFSDFDADAIVVATGATWRRDGVGSVSQVALPGFDEWALVPTQLEQAIARGGSAVVYDDDHYYVGNLVALALAQRGVAVTLATPLPYVGAWMNYTLEQPRVVQQLHRAGVRMLVNTTATGASPGRVQVARSDTGEPLDDLRCDTLVVAAGRTPNLAGLNPESTKLRFIGDCEAPNTIQAAVFAGHRMARELISGDTQQTLRREAPRLFI